ncbi:hypothetical protein L7F22_063485 [Adiantum nelumboides]|nr:hypothetical protein [Adiantum nelumboides]
MASSIARAAAASALSSSCGFHFPQSECRSEPFASNTPSANPSVSSNGGPSEIAFPAFSSPSSLILRFPPNFKRQLSIKARRNCSNIGVAQVVAASATNSPALSDNVATPSPASAGGSLPLAASAADLVVDIPLPPCSTIVNGSAQILNSDKSSTVAVHAGERMGRPKVSDALTTPIVQTSTYTFTDTAQLIAYQDGTYKSFEYGRYGNPTTHAAEQKISALEKAEATLLMASGMSAATTMLLALVPSGGHIVTTTDCYRRTRQFIQTILPKMGITATVIDPADLTSLEHALQDNEVSLFFSESPTNPYLRCIDIEKVSKLCHKRGALVCIDGTFATPINQTALTLGADIALNSVTKYLSGHNDVLAGSLSGSKEVIETVKKVHNVLGGVLDPNSAYLIIRGMKTLHLRVKQQNETALRLAQALELHPKVLRVHYPGLESHPDHLIAKRQMHGCGGVVSFEVSGDLEATSRFIDSLKLPYIAPSLGGCESLVEQPTVISYWDQSPAQRATFGIKDNLVRFSCGIEAYEDIFADIKQALKAV